MSKFLTTSGTSYYIETIIQTATKKLVLVSPYLQLSKTLFERLKDASLREVKIIIVYGKNQLHKQEEDQLKQLTNLELYFFENLHAKCYFNEKEMVITSMNMYEFSEKNNREMGIHIVKKDDNQLFNEAVQETHSIIHSSESITLFQETEEQDEARCIRCEKSIPFNIEKPLCESCFTSWNFFQNLDYEESHCHNCGKNDGISYRYPLCYSCWELKVKSKLTM